MTKQEAFTKMARHLLTQMEKSEGEYEDGDVFCQYRGPRGLQCAVGCLIPDDQYTPDLEDRYVTRIVSKVPALQGLDPDFLRDVQVIHDQSEPCVWNRRLQEYAEENDLIWELDQ